LVNETNGVIRQLVGPSLILLIHAVAEDVAAPEDQKQGEQQSLAASGKPSPLIKKFEQSFFLLLALIKIITLNYNYYKYLYYFPTFKPTVYPYYFSTKVIYGSVKLITF
jgi:hypothetical protein